MSRETASHKLTFHGTSHLEPELESEIRRRMLERIASLPFPAYCQLIRLLLHRSGYSSIQSLGTGADRKIMGHGGLDLLAVAHTDVATLLTGIQIKRYKGTVPRRFVDELRGALPRFGAEQGLLIVTSRFSRKAREVAERPESPAVHLMDGDQLAGRLLERRIGLKRVRQAKRAGWEFDAAYFDALEDTARRWLAAAKTERSRRRR
jgi:restriction endonuclease Mrr